MFYPLNYETFIAFAVKQRAHHHPLAGNRRCVPLQLRPAKVQYFVENGDKKLGEKDKTAVFFAQKGAEDV